MSGVYLSLNQGWTYFKEKYNIKEGKVMIQRVANAWKEALSSTLSDFSFEAIDLKTKSLPQRSDLPLGYELGHICGKYYDANALPSNQTIVDDLRNMISVYRELKGKMYDLSIEKTNDYILAGYQTGVFNLNDMKDDLNNIISNPEVVSLTLYEPPTAILSQQSNVPHARKVNHFKKQINDTKIGLAGEKIVIGYEKKRLIQEGRSDLIKNIEHISLLKGDGAGYDILSYDKDGNKKYIEVKATTGGRDTPFFISDNELQFSISNSTNYCLYRIYDLDEINKKASLYIINGDLTKTFEFRPVNYVCNKSKVQK